MCMVMKKRGYIMRLEDAISVTPYIRSVAENVRGIRDVRIESPCPHASGRRYLRTPYIRSEA